MIPPPRNDVELLRAEYTRLRGDDREAANVIVSYLTGLVAVHAAIFAVFATDAYGNLGDGYKGLVPLVSFGLAGMYLHRSSGEAIRSFYLRAVERALFDREGQMVVDGQSRDVPVPGISTILHQVQKPTSFRPALATLAITGTVLFYSVIAATAGFTVIHMEHGSFRLVFGLLYLTLLLIIILVGWRIGYAARPLWRSSVDRTISQLSSLDPPARAPRPFLRYFVLPRPAEVVLKGGPMMLCGWIGGIVVAAASHESAQIAPRYFAAYLAFELLLYQARYIVNDLASEASDPRHPLADGRRRIPWSAHTDRNRTRRALLLTDAVLRTLIWVAVTMLALPASDRATGLAFGAVLLVAASGYDIARRSAALGTGLGAKLQAFVPLVSIGMGYGLRGTYAVFLSAGSLRGGPFLFGFLFVLGSATVWMAWALSAVAFIENGSAPLLTRRVDERIRTLPHQLFLAQHAGFIEPAATFASIPDDDLAGGCTERILLGRDPPAVRVWDVAGMIAGLLAVAYGVATWNDDVVGAPALLVAIGTMLVATALSLSRRGRLRALSLLGIGCALAIVALAGASLRSSVALVYPALLVVGALQLYKGLSPALTSTDILLLRQLFDSLAAGTCDRIARVRREFSS